LSRWSCYRCPRRWCLTWWGAGRIVVKTSAEHYANTCSFVCVCLFVCLYVCLFVAIFASYVNTIHCYKCTWPAFAFSTMKMQCIVSSMETTLSSALPIRNPIGKYTRRRKCTKCARNMLDVVEVCISFIK